MEKMMIYRVTLKVVGNPDKGQDPTAPLYGVDPATIADKHLDALVEKVWDWQINNGIGAGNWNDAIVMHNGKRLGTMSYNGRIWDDEGKPYIRK
jgi:hypothetical protein